MIDSKNLYRWAFTTLEQKDILKSTDTVAEVKIDYVWNQDRLLLSPEKISPPFYRPMLIPAV